MGEENIINSTKDLKTSICNLYNYLHFVNYVTEIDYLFSTTAIYWEPPVVNCVFLVLLF